MSLSNSHFSMKFVLLKWTGIYKRTMEDFYIFTAVRLLYAEKWKDIENTYIWGLVDKNNRTRRNGKNSCLIRERTTITFISDCTPFMNFLMKTEKKELVGLKIKETYGNVGNYDVTFFLYSFLIQNLYCWKNHFSKKRNMYIRQIQKSITSGFKWCNFNSWPDIIWLNW